MDTLKGWFGSAKDKAGDLAEDVGDAAEKAWDKTKDVAGDVAEKAGDVGEKAWDKTKDVAGDVKDKFDGDDDDAAAEEATE
ncbi:MAG: hypothetical protein KJP12_08025 [Acidimicrobiia bacterium]|nr:hypothetical protein [Acidimicrobiia bacterium]